MKSVISIPQKWLRFPAKSQQSEAVQIDGWSYVGYFFRVILPFIVLNSSDMFPWMLGMMQYSGEFIVEWNRILAFITLTLALAVTFF